MSDEQGDDDINAEVDDDDINVEVEPETSESWVSDGDLHTLDVYDLYEFTGAKAIRTYEGNVYLFMPDGKEYMVEIAKEKFSLPKVAKVSAIK